MADEDFVDIDPMIQTPPASPQMDYPAHVKTYNGFVNLLKWFIIHMALLLIGLYFLVIGDQPGTGSFFILVAVAALAYGLMQNPNLNQNVTSAVTDEPPSE